MLHPDNKVTFCFRLLCSCDNLVFLVALYGTNNFQHLNGHPSAMNYSNAPPARMPLPTVVPPQMQQPTSPQEHHQFTSGSPQMLQPTLPPQMPPSSAALPPPGSGELQQGYFAPPNFTTSQAANKNPVNYAHPPVSVRVLGNL